MDPPAIDRGLGCQVSKMGPPNGAPAMRAQPLSGWHRLAEKSYFWSDPQGPLGRCWVTVGVRIDLRELLVTAVWCEGVLVSPRGGGCHGGGMAPDVWDLRSPPPNGPVLRVMGYVPGAHGQCVGCGGGCPATSERRPRGKRRCRIPLWLRVWLCWPPHVRQPGRPWAQGQDLIWGRGFRPQRAPEADGDLGCFESCGHLWAISTARSPLHPLPNAALCRHDGGRPVVDRIGCARAPSSGLHGRPGRVARTRDAPFPLRQHRHSGRWSRLSILVRHRPRHPHQRRFKCSSPVQHRVPPGAGGKGGCCSAS